MALPSSAPTLTLSDLLWLVPLAAALGLGSVLFWTALSHFRFSRFHRRAGSASPPLGLRGWARLYLATLASAVALVWWYLRALPADRLRTPRGGATGDPVVCVHGFHMAGPVMWGLRRSLERRGRPTAAVFLGLPYRRPEVYAAALARRLAEVVRASPGGRVDLVAHSMGGLVVRLALARRPDLAAAVGHVVTLGTPHRGTALLRRLRRGPVYEMMAPGVPFLADLPTFAVTVPGAAVTTIASAHDLIVYPVAHAHLEGARQVEVAGLGHLGLLTDRRIHALVLDALGGGPDPDREGS